MNTVKYRPIFNICEFLGSMFLVIAAAAPMILFIEVLNSDFAIAVLADPIVVGFVLFALIEIFGYGVLFFEKLYISNFDIYFRYNV